jgi:hypothetical protein
MSAAATVPFAASAAIFGYALVVAVAERRAARAEAERRARAQRARVVLAASEPTPLYDRMVCEQMEKAEGWVQ